MGPLRGIKVIEVGQLIAGPFCGQYLADFGAEVIKIEPPGVGDAMRQWGNVRIDGRTLWWPIIARNKQSVTLDLRQSQGQAILKQLAAKADILVENFRPGTLERWGLGFETLSAVNPGLIMVRVTGYGQTGPYAQRAGYASVGEALGGLRYLSGFPDRPPSRAGISLGDTLAGLHGALGALMALQHRHATGKGQVVDCAIYESVLAVMESLISEYHKGGYVRERSGSFLKGLAPSNVYPTRDGSIVIGANQDTVFRRLCQAMERPELADDPRYRDHAARGEHQTELDDLIGQWTQTQGIAELVERLAHHGVPAGPLYRAPEMLADPHFKARDAITYIEDPHLGEVAMQSPFPQLSESKGAVHHTGPALGEHTEAVLQQWLGMDAPAIAALRQRGVV